MQRPTRNSSLKAMQAIKENSIIGRSNKKKNFDSENVPPSNGTKRHSSPSGCPAPNPKRKTFGDITNAFSQSQSTQKPLKQTNNVQETTAPSKIIEELPKRRSHRIKDKNIYTDVHQPDTTIGGNQHNSSFKEDDTPVTVVQNILKATTLNDDSLRCEECLQEDVLISQEDSRKSLLPFWKDIDQAESHDPLFSTEYAIEIYEYMKRREVYFIIEPYLDTQPFINANMRAILIDWLVEVQENFELFHETLYLAVKIVDRYLERKEVKKEYLQLVGATAMLVASKFEELSPPLVDDFIYLCDDAYNHNELLQMECDILCTMDYDINAPVAYRFLRRYARAAEADLQTHTLARFISESTLQEYEFVADKPSLVAASSLYLAIRMKKLGTWTPTLRHYSGYTITDLIPLVHRLNDLISRPPPAVSSTNGAAPTLTSTVRSKYTHSVFFEVALIPPLTNVDDDGTLAILELETLTKQQ